VCAGLPKKLHSRLLEELEVLWVGKRSRWSIILRVGTCAACKVVVDWVGLIGAGQPYLSVSRGPEKAVGGLSISHDGEYVIAMAMLPATPAQ
jgi:hypothetical protein